MGGGLAKVVRREAEENEVVGCELAGLAMSVDKSFHLGTGVLKVLGGYLEKGGSVVGGRLAGRVSDIRVGKLEGEGGAGGEAEEELERGGPGDGGREVVVGKLGNVEKGGPVVLVEADKVSEVLFQESVIAFGLTVRLRVVDSGEGELCPEFLEEGALEVSGEASVPVGDDGVR